MHCTLVGPSIGSVAYSLNDACTNQAEPFFSRLRRMIDGQHHTVSPQYHHQYATHAAWIEDNRRLDNGALATALSGWRWPTRLVATGNVLAALVSRLTLGFLDAVARPEKSGLNSKLFSLVWRRCQRQDFYQPRLIGIVIKTITVQHSLNELLSALC